MLEEVFRLGLEQVESLIVAGTPTVSSAGGRVTFYSGSVAASNGLTLSRIGFRQISIQQ